MLKIWCEITMISVILFGLIIPNISADLTSQNETDNTPPIDNQTSNFYQINIAVFVDSATVDYYKQNLTIHVMSQLNKTSEMFQYSSIEHSIRIYLVALIIVTEDFTNNNTSNQDEFLDNFCQWKRQNHAIPDYTHHVGILLTRINIYGDDVKRYSLEGSMCSPTNGCAVVVDDGDNTTSHINHVIGDLLNTDEKLKVDLNQGMTDYFWNIINTFFANKTNSCLNQRFEERFDISQELFFNRNQICQNIFGLNFSNSYSFKECSLHVNCTGKPGSMSEKMIVVVQDGIKCDLESYCYYRKCRAIKWSPWMAQEECDRNCGGGIQKLIRNNTSLNNQFGNVLRYETCNNHKCFNTSNDFKPITRDQQCARVNVENRTLMTSYYSEKHPCRLYCFIHGQLKHSSDYYGAVIDGTPCSNDSFHVCINEKCEYSLLTKYYDRYNFTVNSSDTSITRKLSSTLNNSISTEFYSIPYYVRTAVFVDSSMVDFHKENVTAYIKMLMAEASKILKHSSLGFSINIVLIDIRMMKMNLERKNKSLNFRYDMYIHISSFKIWLQDQPDINYDVAILFIRETGGTTYGVSITSNGTYPSPIIVLDDRANTISTIAHEIGHTLGVHHDFDDDNCSLDIDINKIHFLMNHGTSPPFIWSTCSQKQLAQSRQLSFLLKKPEKFIDLSKVPLLGQVYSADKQCEMEKGPGFTLQRTLNDSINQCKEFICSNGFSVRKSNLGMFDFTPCGIGKMCYDNECVEETQLTPIHGGWGQWIPTGICSRSCGIGIIKARRKCNNPLPEYGGDYCVGKKLRFEICSVMPCPEMAVDFRQQQCSKLNNNTRNFTAVYDPKDTDKLCKLTCQAVAQSNDSIIFVNVIDGTPCGNDSHDVDFMCNKGECKKIGCTENDNVFDANSILDICNVSRGFYDNQDALNVETRSQSLSQLLYELPENWTLNNSCIIIHRMKKNWEIILDYCEREKSYILQLTRKYSSDMYRAEKLYSSVYFNCYTTSQKIKDDIFSYLNNMKICRLNYNGITGVTMKSRFDSIKPNTTYFNQINDLENSCKNKTDFVVAQGIIDEKSLMIDTTIKLVESARLFRNDYTLTSNYCQTEYGKILNDTLKNFKTECSDVEKYLSS